MRWWFLKIDDIKSDDNGVIKTLSYNEVIVVIIDDIKSDDNGEIKTLSYNEVIVVIDM